MICFAALMDGDGFWASEEGLALLDATLAGLAAIPAVRLVAAASHPGIGAVAGKHAEVFVPVEPDVEADQAVRNAWATVREKLPEGEPVALVDVRNPAAPAILSDALSLSDGGHYCPWLPYPTTRTIPVSISASTRWWTCSEWTCAGTGWRS